MTMEILVRSTSDPSYIIGNGDEGHGLYLEYPTGEFTLMIGDVMDNEAIEVYVDESKEELRCLAAEFTRGNEGTTLDNEHNDYGHDDLIKDCPKCYPLDYPEFS